MNGIVAWFARNAVAANLLMIVAFVGGVFGYTKMEQEMFPVVNITGASVSGMTERGSIVASVTVIESLASRYCCHNCASDTYTVEMRSWTSLDRRISSRYRASRTGT